MENAVQELRAEFGKQLANMSAKILELQQQIMKKEVEGKGSCSNKTMDVNGTNDLEVVEISPYNVSKNVRVSNSKEINSPNVQIKLMSTGIPKPLKLLHSYAIHALKEKGNRGIKIAIDKNVFGDEQLCHIFFDDIHNFCELEPIPANCICAYTWLLYKECENSNLLGRFQFVDPYRISHDPKVDIVEKGRIIGTRLIGTLPNELALVPCNVGFHWILMVINAHKETVFVLDPLGEENHVREWKDIMDLENRISEVAGDGKDGDVLAMDPQRHPCWSPAATSTMNPCRPFQTVIIVISNAHIDNGNRYLFEQHSHT